MTCTALGMRCDEEIEIQMQVGASADNGPHTRGTRFPGNMTHYRIIQIVPLATHL